MVLLVATGLGLVLGAPFALASRMVAPDEATAVSTLLQFVGGLIVAVVVPPVVAVTMTLLYYDLRVRKEEYDLTTLSREMGFVTA